MQTEMRDGARHLCIDNTRLYEGSAIVGIDIQYSSHARHLDNYAAFQGERATRQSRSRAPWRERHPRTLQGAHHIGSFFS